MYDKRILDLPKFKYLNVNIDSCYWMSAFVLFLHIFFSIYSHFKF